MHELFLNYSAQKLTESTTRITTALSHLTEDQLWTRGAETENAIGNLVLHLSGNLRQWIVFGIGGEPDIRNRDAEFAARSNFSIPELQAKLKEAAGQACAIIRAVTPARLEEKIEVQKRHLTVLEAIYHVVEHFSGHTYQILFAAKQLATASRSAAAAHSQSPKLN